jgi:putative endonuclease
MGDGPGSRANVGLIGEDAAVAGYLSKGYRLVARNWRCRIGEIDVVVARPGLLVFCEVKCRRGRSFGQPFEAVGAVKQRKLRQLAEAFLAGSGLAAERVRFDVASVTLDRGGRPSVYVFEDAF